MSSFSSRGKYILTVLIIGGLLASSLFMPVAQALSYIENQYPAGYIRAQTSQYGLVVIEPDDPDNPSGWYMYLLVQPAIAGITSPIATVKTSTTGIAIVSFPTGDTATVHLSPKGNWLVSDERIHVNGDPALLQGISAFGQWYVPISSSLFWAWEGYYCANVSKIETDGSVIPEDAVAEATFPEGFVWFVVFRWYYGSDDYYSYMFVPLPPEGQKYTFRFRYHGAEYYFTARNAGGYMYRTNIKISMYSGSGQIYTVPDERWHAFTENDSFVLLYLPYYYTEPVGALAYSTLRLSLTGTTTTWLLTGNGKVYYLDANDSSKRTLLNEIHRIDEHIKTDIYYSSPLYVTPVPPFVEPAEQSVLLQGVGTYTVPAFTGGGAGGTGTGGSAEGQVTGTTTDVICDIALTLAKFFGILAAPWKLLSSLWEEVFSFLNGGFDFIESGISAVSELPQGFSVAIGFAIALLVFRILLAFGQYLAQFAEITINALSRAPLLILFLVLAIAISGIASALGANISTSLSSCGFGVHIQTDGSSTGSSFGGGEGGGGGDSGW